MLVAGPWRICTAGKKAGGMSARIRSKVGSQWYVWRRNEDGFWCCSECDWRGSIKRLVIGCGDTQDEAFADLQSKEKK